MSGFLHIKCSLRLFAVTSWYCRESTVPCEGQRFDPFSISRECMQPRGGCWRSSLWGSLSPWPSNPFRWLAGMLCSRHMRGRVQMNKTSGSKLLTLGNPSVAKCHLRQIYFTLRVTAGWLFMAPPIHVKGKHYINRIKQFREEAEFLFGELTDTALHRTYASDGKPWNERGKQGVGWHWNKQTKSES